jgi:hypothetical protein
MKISIDLGWLKVLTETSSRQVRVVAILAVAFLEWQAMMRGIDSNCFGLAVAAISGLAGYGVAKKTSKKG